MRVASTDKEWFARWRKAVGAWKAVERSAVGASAHAEGDASMILVFGATVVVADPLGGEAGERATELAMRVLRRTMEAGGDAVTALAAANRPVVEEHALRGAGCTMATVQADAAALVVTWIGDVRV